MDYLTRVKRRIVGEERVPAARLGDKLLVRDFARLIGVRTTQILARHKGLGLPELDGLPHRFVLKPTFASTSMGVLLLERHADAFVNLATGTKMTEADIRAAQTRVSNAFQKDPSAAEFILEELLVAPDDEIPPQDVRFYMFQGETGLIIREDHMHDVTKAMYFGPDFMPIPNVHSKYGVHPGVAHMETIVEAEVPEGAEELISVARRVSVAVPSPFVRVDLLLATSGVYLGEITFFPGTFYYRNRKIMSPAESLRLGELWGAAEARLTGSVGY